MDDKIFKIMGDLLGLLDQLVEERGVPAEKALADKNIVNTSIGSTVKSPSGLSPNNKKVLVETFTLFNKMFFDYQKKTIPDTAQKTLVSKIASTQKRESVPRPPKKEKEAVTLMGVIIKGLMMLAAAAGVLGAALTGMFGNFTGVAEVVGKVGFMGMLKIISGVVGKSLSLTILRRLPFIGGIISFAFAVQAFQKNKIYEGVGYIISGLLNFIPGVGPFLSLGADILIAWAEAKGAFEPGGSLSAENGWKTIKGWVGNMGKLMWDYGLNLPLIATFKRFGMAYDAFGKGEYVEGLKQIGFGFISIGAPALVVGIEALMGFLNGEKPPTGSVTPSKSWGSKLKGWIQSKLKDLPWYIKQPLSWFGIIPEDSVGAPPGMFDTLVGGKLEAAREMSKKFNNELVSRGKMFGQDMVSATQDYVKLSKTAISKTWENSKTAWADLWKSTSATAMDGSKMIGEDIKTSTGEYAKWVKDNSSKALEKSKTLLGDSWETATRPTGTVAASAEAIVGSAKKAISKISNMSSEKVEVLSKYTSDMATVLADNGQAGAVLLANVYNAAVRQVDLLGMLVNVGNSSLQELKKISGNPSGGNNTTVINKRSSSENTSVLVPVSDNRMGYSTSNYAVR